MILGVIEVLLTLVWWIVFIQAIMSWLIMFNVINTYNEYVRTVWNALKRITDPLYNPIRRILPDFGGLDFSPLIVLLIIVILGDVVIPHIEAWYIGSMPL
jgi:YggT family protein